MKKLLLGLFFLALSAQVIFAAEGFAVLPFVGTAHHKENLDIAAKHLTKKLQEFVTRKGLSKSVVVDFERAKSLVNVSSYNAQNLAELGKELGVRYVLFGDSKQIYLGARYHRFNVYCKAFDVASSKFIDLGHSRHSSSQKLIEFSSYPVLRPKEWKTLSKLSEPFQVFLQEKLGEARAD